MVDFEAVGEVADSGAAGVSVRDDYDFVAAVDEFLRTMWLDGLCCEGETSCIDVRLKAGRCDFQRHRVAGRRSRSTF